MLPGRRALRPLRLFFVANLIASLTSSSEEQLPSKTGFLVRQTGSIKCTRRKDGIIEEDMRCLRSTEKVLRWSRPPTLQVGFALLHNRKLLNHHIHSWSAVDGLATQERLAHARTNALQEETSEERSKTDRCLLFLLVVYDMVQPVRKFLFFSRKKVVVLPCT